MTKERVPVRSEERPVDDAAIDSEEQYRELFASHPTPMAVWDPATLEILDANDAALRQYGYERDEILGLPIDRLVHPEDWQTLVNAMPNLGSGIVGAAVFRHLRKDGSVIEVEVTGHGLRYDGRPARLVMALDVTEKRQLEEQLRDAQKMEAVGRLAGGVAHDFNNLLTAINGYAELLLAELEPGDPRREEAEQIERAGRRAAEITSQLLAFSRRQLLKSEVVDLHAAIHRIEPTITRLVGDSIRIVTDLAADEPFVLADQVQLEQVILNLALNGRDAMPDGGTLTIATGIRAAAPDGGSEVLLTVSDTGAGMDESVQRQVFEPFFSTKGVGKGSGLGLASVYGTVRQSGGQIRVRSAPGRGSSFIVTLPRVAMSDGGDETGEAMAAPGRQAQGTILLAEDEPVVRSLARAVLERTGYTVIEAADGATALALAAQHGDEIDLLLTDVVMPGMTGLELARRLAAMHRGLPIVLMSGYAEEGLPRAAAADGELGFLAKPFTNEALLARIREALQRSEWGQRPGGRLT
jgi:two-component system cell cycle sensor histidine kinase/response regulator CckA